MDEVKKRIWAPFSGTLLRRSTKSLMQFSDNFPFSIWFDGISRLRRLVFRIKHISPRKFVSMISDAPEKLSRSFAVPFLWGPKRRSARLELISLHRKDSHQRFVVALRVLCFCIICQWVCIIRQEATLIFECGRRGGDEDAELCREETEK
jgi:hypothetical protein